MRTGKNVYPCQDHSLIIRSLFHILSMNIVLIMFYSRENCEVCKGVLYSKSIHIVLEFSSIITNIM